MKKFLQNIVKLKEISTIKDFRFGTFPSISGSGSGYTFYRHHRIILLPLRTLTRLRAIKPPFDFQPHASFYYRLRQITASPFQYFTHFVISPDIIQTWLISKCSSTWLLEVIKQAGSLCRYANIHSIKLQCSWKKIPSESFPCISLFYSFVCSSHLCILSYMHVPYGAFFINKEFESWSRRDESGSFRPGMRVDSPHLSSLLSVRVVGHFRFFFFRNISYYISK